MPRKDAYPSNVLRVFVSSTWLDLQPERLAVEQALARLRETKFIGMEHFGSRDETTKDVSLLEVNPADLYVGVIGGRYGSGITEAEYRRALELKLPCFIYFKDEATIRADGRDNGPDRADKANRLARLKEDMRRHCATTFRSPDDLAARLTADLHRWVFDRYVDGLSALRTDYGGRIQNFLKEYLGTPTAPVPFGGRDEDLARLDDWLNDASVNPYLLLAAPAGRGKSALLVRWTQQLLSRQDIGVAFVPVSIRFRTNLAGVVFPAVTARLAALHGEKLAGEPTTPVEVWRGMMSDYLARPLPEGRQLLLVLDGLDEAADWEPGADLFPSNPPPGVRVLVSVRLRAGRSSPEAWLAALGWNSPGLGYALDLERLTRAGVSDVLQKMGCPLDELGRRVDIVAELHRLSEGDPLLVRLYVDDLWKRGKEVTRLRPEDLQRLQPGLKGYFDRWWEDQRRLWGEQAPLREPTVNAVLNLLACALGPLSRDDVLRLVPAELNLNTWTLEEALRPLGRFVIGDGEEQGYVFGHPRLGGYFHERLSGRERQLVEGGFLAWGEETLAELNKGKLPPAAASHYLVQYYGAHVERAGQGPERLLALVSDGWRRAWEELEGSYAGFLNDVGRAWQAAVKADEAQVKRGGQAVYLGGEVRCALCHASVHSLAGNIPPALLKAAVEQGVWTTRQGLAYARQMPELQQRLEALGALAPLLPEPLRIQTLEQAVETARQIADEDARSRALAKLAPQLSGPLLERIIEATQSIGGERARWHLLAALAPQLSGPLLEQALEATRSIRDESASSRALAALAPRQPVPLGIVKLKQALEAARNIGDESDRLRALAALAPHLAEPLRTPILNQSVEAAWKIADEGARWRALADLAPQLTGPLLQKALEVAWKIADEGARSCALAILVPQLTGPLLEQALETARNIADESVRSRALAVLVPQLTGPLLEQALDAARKIGDESARSRALAALAPQLPEPLRTRTFREARMAVRNIRDGQARLCALAALAPQLPEPMRTRAVEREVEETEWNTWSGSNRSRALSELAPYLSGPLLKLALETARTIEDNYTRSRALAALAPHLPEPLRTATLKQVVQAVRNFEDVLYGSEERARNEYAMSSCRAALVPLLPEPLRTRMLNQALEEARKFKDEYARSHALTALAPHLPKPLQSHALEEAVEAVRKIVNKRDRSIALAALAPQLSGALLGQALEVALNIGNKHDSATARASDGYGRWLALAVIALEVGDDSALAELVKQQNYHLCLHGLKGYDAPLTRLEGIDRRALATLAPQQRELLRRQMLEQALNTTLDIGDVRARSTALKELTPLLNGSLLEQAAAAARAIADGGYSRSDRASSEHPRSHALKALAAQLAVQPASTLAPFWSETLLFLAGRTRSDFLAGLCALMPVILPLGGPQSAADIFQAIHDVGKWWP